LEGLSIRSTVRGGREVKVPIAKAKFAHNRESLSVDPLKKGDVGRKKKMRKRVITRRHHLGIRGFLTMNPLMSIRRGGKEKN